jgi:hypothetical protein
LCRCPNPTIPLVSWEEAEMRHRCTAGCLVAFTVTASAFIMPAKAVWPWLADGDPPHIVLPELVVDQAFDAAAWQAAEVADEHALWKVRVALDCGRLDRTEWMAGEQVSLNAIVSGETLAQSLRPGPCTLMVEAWDRSTRWKPVQERLDWYVYEGGSVMPADGLHADGTPPTITVGARSTVLKDALSGIASVEVQTRCGPGPWKRIQHSAYARLEHRVELAPLLPDLEGALPWSGQPGPCEGRITAIDHAGHTAEERVRWHRYADAAVPEERLLSDIVGPTLEGTELSGMRLVDASGLASVASEITCSRQQPRQLPTQQYVARVQELPLSALLPRELPEGACRLRLSASDHAGRPAEHVLELEVGSDGRVRLAPPAGDLRPPRLVGPLRTLEDLLGASWFDEAPGVTHTAAQVRCANEVPVALVPRVLAEPVPRVPVLEGSPPLVQGRCEIALAAVDGEGLAATASLSLFAYGDGTIVPTSRLDEEREPALVGLRSAFADGRVSAREWASLRVVDPGAGLAEVRVRLACRRGGEPFTQQMTGPVADLTLAALMPSPASLADGRRCPLELFAVDHAGNVLVTTTSRARFE